MPVSIRSRHSGLAHFAAALLLTAFVGRELWLRRGAVGADAKIEPSKTQPIVLTPDRPPLPLRASERRTETAVIGVPPIKLTRVQRRRPKTAPVPAPR